MKSMLKRAGALLLVGAVFAACSESNTDTLTGPEFAGTTLNVSATTNVILCKVFANADGAGDYNFTWSAPGNTPDGGNVMLAAADATDGNTIGACGDPTDPNNPAIEILQIDRGTALTVSEDEAVAGTAILDPVVPVGLFQFDYPGDCGLDLGTYPNPSAGTVRIEFNDTNCGGPEIWLVFKNIDKVDPPGGEGCTPGYWRQPHHFGNYTFPYLPDTPFHDVFAGDDFGTQTLSEVVAARGGGINALARHAVAALLNAAHPDISYGYATPEEVIALYDAAYTGDRATLNAQRDEFDELNNAGCELGRAELS